MHGEVAMMTKLPLDAGEPGALSQLQVWGWGLGEWNETLITHHPYSPYKTPCKGGGERIVKDNVVWSIYQPEHLRHFLHHLLVHLRHEYDWNKAISEVLFSFHCISAAAPVAPSAVSIQCHCSHPQEGTAHGRICYNIGHQNRIATMALFDQLFWLHHQTTWMLKLRDARWC